MGKADKIKKDLLLHKKMQSFGFPVARLIDEGEINGSFYFIEESLGAEGFGNIFEKEVQNTGRIQDKIFNTFIDICSEFAEAQLKTATQDKDWDDFRKGIHLHTICEELPREKDQIMRAYEETQKRLSIFPFLLAHGDLTPFNVYPKGVIDLEDSFMAPAGYDLGALTETLNWFPESKDYEYYQRYTFTREQKQKFLDRIDTIYSDHKLPKVSHYLKDFNFTKGIWSAVRMSGTPKLQQFRYSVLRKLIVNLK